MPAIPWNVTVEQGSWEPSYITVTDPVSGQPLDLTAPGYSVRAVVSTRPDRLGTVLADLPDSPSFRRTAAGRIYFQPEPAVTSGWAWRRGFWQVELAHPTGRTVRIATGQLVVSPELVV